MPEIEDIVDRMHSTGALRAGVEAAVNLVLGKRGGTVADPVELEDATAEMVRVSRAHVRSADEAFDRALADREKS